MSSVVREVPVPSGVEESRPALSIERAVHAVEVTSRYARHDRVRVWYNPLNPADAVISRKPEWFLFAAIALLWAVWVRTDYVTRSRRQMRAAAQRRSGRSPGF